MRARPASEWTARGMIAAAVAVAGAFSVSHTLGYGVRLGNPELAHTLAPLDGRVTASLARVLAGPEATPSDRARADRLARAALDQDATAVPAAATLGINAQVRGDTAAARRLFAYSAQLSRRDLPTQLWAIEDAVARNDIPDAVRQYDIALRTTRNAPDILFPVLAQASADPAIAAALFRVLAGRPSWGDTFINFLSVNSSDPVATARLFSALRRVGVGVPEHVDAALLDALTTMRTVDAAWNYYASIRPGAIRSASRDPKFTAQSATPSRFDWTVIDNTGVAASILSGSDGGQIDYAAPAGVGGPVAAQWQMLPAGPYRIEGHSLGINQPANARPHWVLSCPDGRELGRVPVPNSDLTSGRFSGGFTVPADCPLQTLTLIVPATDAPAGSVGQFDYVKLARVG